MPSYLQRLALVLAFIQLSKVSALVNPTVILDNGTFIGTTDGVSSRFLGIPFARPPIGDLRFRLPQPIEPYKGEYSVGSYGPSCPQQAITLPIIKDLPADVVNYMADSIYGFLFPDSEDCLTINVFKPEDANANSNLPVLVWIFGGGFVLGGPSMYDGASIVSRSVLINNPVIVVSMNYRYSPRFGFMASREVKEAKVGNLGLHDQREAFRWIQKYIRNFGGDPSKVTIWGESAGAISVALHMVAYDGDTQGLFRAGIMQSGAPIPVGDITNGQQYYDFVVSDTGCAGSVDTLECLRRVPYDRLKAAIDKTPSVFAYQALHLAWLPRADGVLFSDHPQRLVQRGKIARIPYITGDCDDEGTFFSLSNLNVTTDDELKEYIQSVFLPGVTEVEVDRMLLEYPRNISQGSPFNTGPFNAITPQYKRIAAFQGDGVFQGPRRWMLDYTADSQDAWVFLSKRLKALPVLGSVHAHDLLNSYGGGELQNYIIRFANVLNPNLDSFLNFNWPKYRLSNRQMITFVDSFPPVTITLDNYRVSAMNYLNQVVLRNPV
ncbi:carotenoid ester lipase precursor [Coprinopsis marcescibilis]|uniref:Carboxylic ester hydrolase n=1 Tax=Coprinopsis marcescibilis TaxID=230819 RepID=A0A5C3L4L2_COPMA|nr:carotenoid ester lipase precursor [Coprinopsis marcescibilis]